tara:strand:- start:313 stop:753 length:441 start_codon:yes stop_codon:yes gene_type:complete
MIEQFNFETKYEHMIMEVDKVYIKLITLNKHDFDDLRYTADDELINDTVAMIIQDYGNTNTYDDEFNSMRLWDDCAHPIEGLCAVMSYIVKMMRARGYNDYNLDVECYTDLNKLKQLFQYVYVNNNKETIRYILRDILADDDDTTM